MAAGPIVVATDFSARSDRAVDRAVLLAQQLDRPLKIFHATDPARAANNPRGTIDRRMRELVGDAGLEIELLCPQGPVPDAIATALRDVQASLLVMGVARYNSIGDYFLGTAVDHVLRHCEIPALIVKRRPVGPYERVLLGTDFSSAASQVMKDTRAIFPNARIHAVHAYHVPFESWQKAEFVKDELRSHVKTEMERFVSGYDNIEGEVIEGETGRVIMDAIERHDVQLVAIGSHGHSGFRQAFLGSTTSDLLRELDADALVIKPPR